MKKRFLGALLALCVCLTLLPGTARSAYEPPTEVPSVSVSVPTPVADGKFADAKPTAESSAPYFVGSSRWTRVTAQGGTAVLVSHDVEFCAQYADLVGLFFDGQLTTVNTPRRFFADNSFYTTAANRMSRHIFRNAVTAEDVAELCRRNGL